MLQLINEQFTRKPEELNTYSPLTFAYIGDCVFDMIIRTLIVEDGQRAANSLHKHTTGIVNAATQAALIMSVHDDILTQEEQDIYRRGRNAKSYTKAKNQSTSDYRKATGFEALCGYLYLKDEMPRLLEIIRIGLERLEIKV